MDPKIYKEVSLFIDDYKKIIKDLSADELIMYKWIIDRELESRIEKQKSNDRK